MKMEKQSSSSRSLRRDKGVAGLTILLSVVAMIFIIGFLVMVFAIIGAQLGSNSATTASATVNNETGSINSTGYTLDGASAMGFNNPSIILALNATANTTIAPGNYTLSSAGVVTNATDVIFTDVLFTYSYSYTENNTATEVISDTTTSIAGVTSWFPIIITISVMVALILLTVIIIVAIRQSGILAGGQ